MRIINPVQQSLIQQLTMYFIPKDVCGILLEYVTDVEIPRWIPKEYIAVYYNTEDFECFDGMLEILKKQVHTEYKENPHSNNLDWDLIFIRFPEIIREEYMRDPDSGYLINDLLYNSKFDDIIYTEYKRDPNSILLIWEHLHCARYADIIYAEYKRDPKSVKLKWNLLCSSDQFTKIINTEYLNESKKLDWVAICSNEALSSIIEAEYKRDPTSSNLWWDELSKNRNAYNIIRDQYITNSADSRLPPSIAQDIDVVMHMYVAGSNYISYNDMFASIVKLARNRDDLDVDLYKILYGSYDIGHKSSFSRFMYDEYIKYQVTKNAELLLNTCWSYICTYDSNSINWWYICKSNCFSDILIDEYKQELIERADSIDHKQAVYEANGCNKYEFTPHYLDEFYVRYEMPYAHVNYQINTCNKKMEKCKYCSYNDGDYYYINKEGGKRKKKLWWRELCSGKRVVDIVLAEYKRNYNSYRLDWMAICDNPDALPIIKLEYERDPDSKNLYWGIIKNNPGIYEKIRPEYFSELEW